jgi:hypothetical protein
MSVIGSVLDPAETATAPGVRAAPALLRSTTARANPSAVGLGLRQPANPDCLEALDALGTDHPRGAVTTRIRARHRQPHDRSRCGEPDREAVVLPKFSGSRCVLPLGTTGQIAAAAPLHLLSVGDCRSAQKRVTVISATKIAPKALPARVRARSELIRGRDRKHGHTDSGRLEKRSA